MIRFFAAFALLISTTLPVSAFDTQASAAYVVDQTTGTVLLNKNADEPLPPASMSKLMTLIWRSRRFSAVSCMTDELVTSAHANSFGGSTMFLRHQASGSRSRI